MEKVGLPEGRFVKVNSAEILAEFSDEIKNMLESNLFSKNILKETEDLLQQNINWFFPIYGPSLHGNAIKFVPGKILLHGQHLKWWEENLPKNMMVGNIYHYVIWLLTVFKGMRVSGWKLSLNRIIYNPNSIWRSVKLSNVQFFTGTRGVGLFYDILRTSIVLKGFEPKDILVCGGNIFAPLPFISYEKHQCDSYDMSWANPLVLIEIIKK